MKERARLRDTAQAASFGPEGVTEAPANNKGNGVEGGVVEGGVNGGSVDISGTEPTPENYIVLYFFFVLSFQNDMDCIQFA